MIAVSGPTPGPTALLGPRTRITRRYVTADGTSARGRRWAGSLPDDQPWRPGGPGRLLFQPAWASGVRTLPVAGGTPRDQGFQGSTQSTRSVGPETRLLAARCIRAVCRGVCRVQA